MGSLLAIIFVYIIYYLFSVNKYDKNGHYKDKDYKKNKKNKNKKKLTKQEVEELKKKDYDKLPNEVKYFVSKYRIDLDKVNLRGLLKMTGLVLGICIAAATLTVVTIFKNKDITLEIIVAFVIVLVLYLISLKIMGRYFEKKGLTKDE